MKESSYHHGDLPAALLQAAEKELAEHGIERFSLRAVAKRAGVSHAAPAHHFKDLQGLLTALAARGYERLVDMQIRRQESAESDARARIVASGLGYIDFAIAHPALFRLMFSSERPDRSDLAFSNATFVAFDKLVAETRAVSGEDPYESASAMRDLVASWALVHGLAELIVSGRAARPLRMDELGCNERDEMMSDILRRCSQTVPDERT